MSPARRSFHLFRVIFFMAPNDRNALSLDSTPAARQRPANGVYRRRGSGRPSRVVTIGQPNVGLSVPRLCRPAYEGGASAYCSRLDRLRLFGPATLRFG